MSALARWFLAQNWTVSGSDASNSPLLQDLKKEGINVKIGQHKATSLPHKTNLVIESQAIAHSNPEHKKAEEIGARIYSYPEMIGILTREYETIGISGAHGKSTTTAIMSVIMLAEKKDPTIIIGTKMRELGGKNFRSGKSEYLVLEADEYGRAFYNYSPFIGVITTIDKEHLDTYRDLNDIKSGFLKYISNIKSGGYAVMNGDDKNINSIRDKILKICEANNIHGAWYSRNGSLAEKIRKTIKIPGEHNVSNALAAVSAAAILGITENKAIAAISRFKGSWRRMELRGKIHSNKFPSGTTVTVYDDYAHHPTEIRASLEGLRAKYPEWNIICVFQPHQAKRLDLLFNEFSESFGAANRVIIIPVYKVKGRDIPLKSKHGAKALAKLIAARNKKIKSSYLDDPKLIKKELIAAATGKSIVVMMGAGDINLLTDKILSKPLSR